MPAAVAVGAVVTTRIPYKPIGPWIEGCVPDSIRYVPGFNPGCVAVQLPKHNGVVVVAVLAVAATSVPNDCTRGP